ncbi:hypothetical protein GMD78_00090 [Ornithinibacillus sp. L9]|uniref:Uncharacterized protein n=1 Tax=Ornithinibacillus caprae TaxID=2678566 RepID=A0A6N8FAY0_9BACI|nr:hypothetical protein [Ornithinibacillus caprae]MUK86802.1 hypothetical protein [Ornithinibacillus caprae]
MKNATIIVIALLALFIIGITIYSYESDDSIVEDVNLVAENAFHEESEVEANYHSASFSFYLPDGLDVEDEDENNVILHNDDQTYIVFYNKFEEPTSQLNFNNANNDEAILFESYEDQDKFGYVRVTPTDEKDYELQVGIGGVKITTLTTKSKIEQDTEEVMKIARSILESNEM